MGLQTKRAVVAVLIVAGLLAARGAAYFGTPQVSWSVATGVPRVDFRNEWQTRGLPSFLGWSPDGASLTSITGYGGWPPVWDLSGRISKETPLPIPYTSHFVLDP